MISSVLESSRSASVGIRRGFPLSIAGVLFSPQFSTHGLIAVEIWACCGRTLDSVNRNVLCFATGFLLRFGVECMYVGMCGYMISVIAIVK